MSISKITKKLFCLTCVVALSSSAAFAQSAPLDANAIKNNEARGGEISVMASSTPITSYGGHGEYGWGLFNAWAKYAHDDYEHRVVLQTDDYSYGAWELAGGNNYSYKEHKKGKTNVGSGEIR
ncbi:hypothetical protein [Sinanaerobacter sp. ZZT-01]|uniref:hypothetical protein n=1 Tax=Sinanaerobacter sp. ZZT-01 TaxID=3111540 RepID=UPI002D7769C5|nr:hypothetical protein [Sinanaerobacter sp. ZZT-01]WRR94973.1 hypothetical protein U5921_07585 [Sinanaerobacter sp. ZZT-01]